MRSCQFCHLVIVPPANFYLLNELVTCLSCRRIFYAIWKELHHLCILDYIKYKNSPEKISKIILKNLNFEPIKVFCLQFLDFSSTRNYARCPTDMSNDFSINAKDITRKLRPLTLNRKSHNITGKYVKLCRLCRFRKMLLSVREIPKSKLILKLDKYSEEENEILNLYAADRGHGQKTTMTIFLGEELREIFINSHLIFDHLETLIRKIEHQGGYSDLTSPLKQGLKSENFNATVKSVPHNKISSDRVTEDGKIIAYNFQGSKAQKFYELKLSVSRFHEFYTINMALGDMCKLFQMFSDKIDGDLARREQKSVGRPNANFKAIELLPQSTVNQKKQISGYNSSCPTDELSSRAAFNNITEINRIFGNETKQLNINVNIFKIDASQNNDRDWVSHIQNIKKKIMEQSKSERIQEILQELKSESISADSKLNFSGVDQKFSKKESVSISKASTNIRKGQLLQPQTGSNKDGIFHNIYDFVVCRTENLHNVVLQSTIEYLEIMNYHKKTNNIKIWSPLINLDTQEPVSFNTEKIDES